MIRSYHSGEAEGIRAVREACDAALPGRRFSFRRTTTRIRGARGWSPRCHPTGWSLDQQLTGEILDFKPLILKAQEAGADSYGICMDIGKIGALLQNSSENSRSTGRFRLRVFS